MTGLSKKTQNALNKFVSQLNQQKYTQTLPSRLDIDDNGRQRFEKLQKEANKAVKALLEKCPEALSLTNIHFEYMCAAAKESAEGSLLAIAAKKSYPFCVALIEAGCDVNRQNAEGDTPLHLLAKRNGDNDSDTINLLKGRGANLHILNNKNETAFSVIRTPDKTILSALCPDTFVAADFAKIAKLSANLFKVLLTKTEFKEAVSVNQSYLLALATNNENVSLLGYFAENPKIWLPSEVAQSPLKLMQNNLEIAYQKLKKDTGKNFTQKNAEDFSNLIASFKELIDEQESWPAKEICNLIPHLLQYVGHYFFDIMQKLQEKTKTGKKGKEYEYIKVSNSEHERNFNNLWERSISPIFQFFAKKIKENENISISLISLFDQFELDAYQESAKDFQFLEEAVLNGKKLGVTEPIPTLNFVKNDETNEIQVLLLKKLISIPGFGKLVLKDLYYHLPNFLADLMYFPNDNSMYLFKDVAEIVAESKYKNPKIQSALKLQLMIMRNPQQNSYLNSLGGALNHSEFIDNSIAILPSDVYAIILMFNRKMDPNIFNIFLRVTKKTNTAITELDSKLSEKNWHALQYASFGESNEALKNILTDMRYYFSSTSRKEESEVLDEIKTILEKIKKAFSLFLRDYLIMYGINIKTAYIDALPKNWLELMFNFNALWDYKDALLSKSTIKDVAEETKINIEALAKYMENESGTIELAMEPANSDIMEIDRQPQAKLEENATSLSGKRKYEEFALLNFLIKRSVEAKIEEQQPIAKRTVTPIKLTSANFFNKSTVKSPLDFKITKKENAEKPISEFGNIISLSETDLEDENSEEITRSHLEILKLEQKQGQNPKRTIQPNLLGPIAMFGQNSQQNSPAQSTQPVEDKSSLGPAIKKPRS